MKIGIILETKEFEKAWNAFRFAVTAKKICCKLGSVASILFPEVAD